MSNGGTGLSSLTQGYIPYGTGTSAFGSTSGLFWDSTNSRLGIGFSSPTAQIEIAGYPNATFKMGDGGTGTYTFSRQAGDGYFHSVDNSGSFGFIWATGSTEIMRTSGGNLLVGTTSTVVGGKLSVSVNGTPGGFACTSSVGGVVLDLNRTGSTSGDVVYIRTSGSTLAGYITCPTSNTTSYLSISDYRLKTDIKPLTGALDRLMQLKPCTYTWKANNIKSEGFIAHELQSVIPEAVGGVKDAVNEDGSPKYQGVDAGSASLIAVLSAALQELNNKFDAYVASHP